MQQLGGRLTCGLHALVCRWSGPSLNNSAEVHPNGEHLSEVTVTVLLVPYPGMIDNTSD